MITDASFVGAGVESMTQGYGAGAAPNIADEILENQDAETACYPWVSRQRMSPRTTVSLAKSRTSSRRSPSRRPLAANKAGKFRDEIVPITVKWIDPKTEKESTIVVDQDDGIRDGVTAESLGKLKPAFSKDGFTHAGMRHLDFLLYHILTVHR